MVSGLLFLIKIGFELFDGILVKGGHTEVEVEKNQQRWQPPAEQGKVWIENDIIRQRSSY